MSEDHHHLLPTTPVEERVNVLEALLTEKGIIDPLAMDEVIAHYEHEVGPMNGAKVVARGVDRWLLLRPAARGRDRRDR